jgi:hypothetical protein
MGRRSGSSAEIRNRLADKRRDFPQILSTEYKHCHSEHDKQFLHANLPHGIDCSVPDLQGITMSVASDRLARDPALTEPRP